MGLFVISCNNGNYKTETHISISKPKITVYNYLIWSWNLNKKELRDSITVYIDTITFNNRTKYVYCDSLEYDSICRYSFSIKRDSFFYFDEYCKTLDTILLDYKNDKIELFKSDYDVENSVDEECYIYWNKKYGLISVYNYPWGVLILFDNEEIIGFAKETIYDFIINQEKEIQKEMDKEMQKSIKRE